MEIFFITFHWSIQAENFWQDNSYASLQAFSADGPHHQIDWIVLLMEKKSPKITLLRKKFFNDLLISSLCSHRPKWADLCTYMLCLKTDRKGLGGFEAIITLQEKKNKKEKYQEYKTHKTSQSGVISFPISQYLSNIEFRIESIFHSCKVF